MIVDHRAQQEELEELKNFYHGNYSLFVALFGPITGIAKWLQNFVPTLSSSFTVASSAAQQQSSIFRNTLPALQLFFLNFFMMLPP